MACSSQGAVDFVHKQLYHPTNPVSCAVAAQRLVLHAQRKHSTDNISAVVVLFKQKPVRMLSRRSSSLSSSFLVSTQL